MSGPANPESLRVLSIQSAVAYGYAGNSAAVFPLQRLGVEVHPVYTVNFSNHTGYGTTRGPLIAPEDIREVLRGVEDRGAFAHLDAVLSGYQGDAKVGELILDAVEKAKAARPGAIYVCDPVMGDVGRGFFVRPGIPEYLRDEVVPRADVITPNQFELDFLAGAPASATLDEVLAAVETVRAGVAHGGRGPRNVLVTSVQVGDDSTLDMVAVDDEGAYIVTTPTLPIVPKGGGDVTAAVYTAHLLRHGFGKPGSTEAALGATANTMYAVLGATVDAGRDELALIQAQEAIAHPPTVFEVKRLR